MAMRMIDCIKPRVADAAADDMMGAHFDDFARRADY